MLTFSIKSIASKKIGSTENHIIDEVIPLEEEYLLCLSNFTGKARFLKLEHEINVEIKDFAIDVEAVCSRCLKKFPFPIFIYEVSREFIIDLPEEEMMPGEDSFFVDMKTWELSLLEMVRQEIILHFPAFPVCSESCKGLCVQCGIDLNTKECNCVARKEVDQSKPFQPLKNLLRNH